MKANPSWVPVNILTDRCFVDITLSSAPISLILICSLRNSRDDNENDDDDDDGHDGYNDHHENEENTHDRGLGDIFQLQGECTQP